MTIKYIKIVIMLREVVNFNKNFIVTVYDWNY